jgi:hypothetical protein
LVILRDHGRLLPKPGFLAQMSQTAATGHSLVDAFGKFASPTLHY